MKNLIYKILGGLGLLFTFFRLGKTSGKNDLKNEINEQILKNAKESKKRQIKRASDDINTVYRRVSKYIRK